MGKEERIVKIHKFRLLYMEPPVVIDPKRTPKQYEFTLANSGVNIFDDAYDYAKGFIKKQIEGTQLLFLAQLTR
jgi:hypothetical protein